MPFFLIDICCWKAKNNSDRKFEKKFDEKKAGFSATSLHNLNNAVGYDIIVR